MKETMNADKNAEMSLQAAIAQLPKEIVPERDLWSGIDKAINQSATLVDSNDKRKAYTPAAWAASIVAAVLLTWVTLGPEQLTSKPQINLVAAMQQDFEQQKQTMLVNLARQTLSNYQ
jgi:hypothetical protein